MFTIKKCLIVVHVILLLFNPLFGYTKAQESFLEALKKLGFTRKDSRDWVANVDKKFRETITKSKHVTQIFNYKKLYKILQYGTSNTWLEKDHKRAMADITSIVRKMKRQFTNQLSKKWENSLLLYARDFVFTWLALWISKCRFEVTPENRLPDESCAPKTEESESSDSLGESVDESDEKSEAVVESKKPVQQAAGSAVDKKIEKELTNAFQAFSLFDQGIDVIDFGLRATK